ncbi:DNA-binding protein [Streptomyces sp. G-G2]|uniref:DNA-binding protein n=1 Tax=Streptomyces sp. G-G2 TaxID=3046201 RepID=UPI0024B9AF3D|nr:DNA-binding protein [Streptomyces sp. G-G2]MDJ0379886.1 DNA-binding protein [Streptomyces sp. G-G2]
MSGNGAGDMGRDIVEQGVGAADEAGKADAVRAAGLLLKAGAVLPCGVQAGPGAVELTARAYRHPALGDDRVVVRLATAELGPAEDLAAGFLGLVPDGEPVVVGLGRRQALGFPAWVLVHHPEDGQHALAVVPELDRLARQAKTRPKATLDGCLELGGRLAASVPHFLPVYFEQAARLFLAVDNTTYAAQLFARARTSEARHGLTVDEDRVDAVFLEFALAGALPVKVLTGYGKELATRVGPAEAHERFRRLCVRRTAGGLPPSAQAATELRRLARAAGLDPAGAEQDHLAELLSLPATLRAAHGWWKAHRAPLVALARRNPDTRGSLLALTPPGSSDHGAELSALWLEILEESGATAGLCSADLPEGQRSPDGTAGWLERFHAARHAGWGSRPSLPLLLDLVTRAAGQLRAELDRPWPAPVGEPGPDRRLDIGVQDADLLDLLLSLDLPVADPDPRRDAHAQLNLRDWVQGEQRRELTALAADPRFRAAFTRAAHALGEVPPGPQVLRGLAASAGGRIMLTEWMRTVAAESAAAGLPGLPAALARLNWLPTEALELAPREVAAAVAADLAETLARTLRGGLFEELAWPAWDEALAALAVGRGRQDLTVVDAWPHLIVANATQVHVIDAHSTVLVHDLRAPHGSSHRHGFHYVDGELLVLWATYGGDVQGYWHHSPDQVFTVGQGTDGNDRGYWSLRSSHVSLPLPGGGRTVGGGVVHRGDTLLPVERPVLCDGASYWVWEAAEGEGEPGWREYDPVGGGHGRRSLPAFLADAQRELAHDGEPAGPCSGNCSCQGNWLRPAPAVPDSVLGGPVDGLLGWCAVRVPGRGWRARDTAGRQVAVPEGREMPVAALTFPGDDRPRALTHHWRELTVTDPDGVVTLESRGGSGETFHTGSTELPPLGHWYALRPRDPQGSAALRAADRESAASLLKAAAADHGADRAALVSAALPEITDPKLIGGVVEVLGLTLTQQGVLDRAAARLHPDAAAAPGAVPGPADGLLDEALGGLTGPGYHRWHAPQDFVHRYLHALGAARADTDAVAVPDRVHYAMPDLARSGLPWAALLDQPAALAYRAVATATTDAGRAAVLGLLGTLDALGLGSAAGSADSWRRAVVHLAPSRARTSGGPRRAAHHPAVLPLGGGAVLALTDPARTVPDGHEFDALLHDPTGRFTVPEPYTLRGLAPLGDPTREADWLARFLTEAADRGPVPWLPDAAAEFARLTGASAALAALVVAGLPHIDGYEHNFLPTGLRTLLGVKVADAAAARTELKDLAPDVRRTLIGALLPTDPAALWTRGPDTAAAAEVWNRHVGRRTPVPEWLLAEAVRDVRTAWGAHRALPALLDPASAPELSTDVPWGIKGDHAEPLDPADRPFTTTVLTSAVALTAWLAHRLPAGDPVRAALPSALTAVRRRLDAPGLLLSTGEFARLGEFRKAAGTPTGTGEGFERYGAVLMATADDQPKPALRPTLLDSAGTDPYLTLLRGARQHPTRLETALAAVRDADFAALLADPGAPAAGSAGPDGTWWPQDPSRSVPELVTEAATTLGLGADAAALYLALLAMPDPTDRNTARWTGWKPVRLKAARSELAATEVVVSATRARAGRTLFLPGGWTEPAAPALPLEQWKLPLYGPLSDGYPGLGVLAPAEPAAHLYRRAWRRIREGDAPRFETLKVKRTRRR